MLYIKGICRKCIFFYFWGEKQLYDVDSGHRYNVDISTLIKSALDTATMSLFFILVGSALVGKSLERVRRHTPAAGGTAYWNHVTGTQELLRGFPSPTGCISCHCQNFLRWILDGQGYSIIIFYVFKDKSKGVYVPSPKTRIKSKIDDYWFGSS